jgi:hypothetical protein
LKLTIDSTEALEDTLRVVGALYDVTLQVAPNEATGSVSGKSTGHATSASARSTRGKRASAKRRPGNRTNGKPAGGGQPRTRSKSDGRASTAAVRTWARENGYTVADRGRVPTEVVAAYRRRQPA